MGILPTPEINPQPAEQTLATHVKALRKTLVALNAWPEAGDDFVSLMSYSHWDMLAVHEKDFEWIPQVVADALNETDIGFQYPSFFQKLITNADLRHAFLVALTNASVSNTSVES